LVEILEKYGDNPESMQKAGVLYATDQIIELFANDVKGIHLYTMNKVEAARLLVYKAAWRESNNLPYSLDAARAKLFAAETAMEVTTKAVQIFGGYGYTREYPVERMMRDAKITEIYEGTSEVQRMVIAANIIK